MSRTMRSGEAVVVALALLSVVGLVGCGTSPAYRGQARIPEGGIRVVPASQVKGTCQCDDDVADEDDEDLGRPRSKPVEYVKLREWQAPVAVQQFEAENPPRGDTPPTYTNFPRLTLHAPIGSSTFRSSRWTGAYPR